MPKLPRVSAAVVVRALKRIGFYAFSQEGSHIQFRHVADVSLRVIIPFHHGDVPLKTLKSIIKQSGLTVEGFIDLL